MVRCKIVCIAHILFYLFVQLPTQAQLVTGFRADKTAGCSPLTVSFTNTTRGASANATYTWNFGNGNALTTADAVDPVAAIYYTPRTYRVTLTVKDRRRTSKVSTNIIVYENPTIGFTITPASGCIPLIVTLASTSAPGSGTITQYFWDFGDGKTLKTASVTAMDTFAMAGTYTPSLTATDSHGCSSTLAQPNAIVALQPPAAIFSVQSARLCQVGDTARFTNTSTGATGYRWSFGDGSTSTAINPVHRYTAQGSYKVTLVAVNAGGCSDSLVRTVSVALLQPAITVGAGAICAGAPIRFNSTPAGSAQWSFGDGAVASGSVVSHAFVSAGTYTVSLADTSGTCPAGTSLRVTVNPSPVVNGFETSENAVCAAPVLVHFTDTSKGGVRWKWGFTGLPPDTSTKQNPSFLFPTAQAYQTTLTVTNAQGCSSTVTQPVYPTGKTAGLQVEETLSPSTSICAAVSVTCGAVTSDNISQYTWAFGDGSGATGAHPTHTYLTPGTYTISLAYTTEHGCTGVASTDTIHVYPKPVAAFTFADSGKCADNHLEIFHNRSDSAAQFDWVFGDGVSQVSGDSSLTHYYAKIGQDTVLLIASSPGCAPDTTTRIVNIAQKATPKGAPIYTCAGNRDTVALTDSTAGGALYVWNWGDGSKPDTDNVYLPQKTHVYAGGGTYSATITGVFGACTVTCPPIPVYVLSKQHPLLRSTTTAICESGPLPVTITGLDTNFLGWNTVRGGYGYTLSRDLFPDTSSVISGSIRTTYTGSLQGLVSGEDSLRVILLSIGYGCADTTNDIPLRISGPRAAFSLVSGDPCSHGPIVFRDSSHATGGAALVSWRWRFGDSTQTLRTNGDTVMHVYTAPGDYVPTLEVTDAKGCSQTATRDTRDTLIVAAPIANFFWSPLSILPGVPVTFYNTSKAAPGTTYTWTFFSDGSTSHAPDSLLHTYGPISRDTVRLVATPPPGQPCADTSIQVVDVTSVTATFTDSTAYLSFNGCPPMVAYFSSKTLNAVGVHWDFGDGATAGDNPGPSHTYYSPGAYTVVLTAYGAGGDSIQVRDTVHVNGPKAILHSSLTQACSPATDTLIAMGSHSHTYTWDFGDGTVFVTADTLAIHRYATSGVYAPALLVSDSTGCQAVFRLNTPLVLDTLNVQPFSLRTVCDTGVLTFLPLVSSLEADSLGKTLQYLWNFGTGRVADTAATQNTSFDFGVEGAYVVTLAVQSPAGCASTVLDTVQVAAPLGLQYPPHTDLCVGTTAVLRIQGSENYSYQWTPARTLTLMSDRSALVNADTNTTYKVVVSGPFGCYTDTLSMAVSARPLPTVTIALPTPVSAGGSVTLHSTVSSDVVSQTWSPGLYLSCTTCAAPVSTPLDQISYTDTVYTEYGCKAADTTMVTLVCSEGSVRIPSGFTPNGDGNNDYFMPIGRGVKVVLHFQVYSRYGDLIYTAENLPIGERQTGIGWDGRNNGREMPPGTYVYVMEFECLAGQTFMQKGTVELIR